MTSPAVSIGITSKDEQVLASLKRLQREFKELDGSIDKPRKTARGLGDVLRDNAGSIALGAGLLYVNREAEEAAASMRSTQAVIASTGNAAEVSAEQQDKLVESLSKLGGVDDEVVNAGANMLRTFTQIEGDNFGLALASALDISAMKGQDLASVAEQIGKALNDPVAGMGKLAKQGVVLSEVQKQQVRDFAAVGDIASAQMVVLKELEVEYGGQAEAAATASGKARVAFDNAAESLGTSLAPAMQATADVITAVSDGFGALPGPVQVGVTALGAGAIAIPKLVDGGTKLVETTKMIAEASQNAGAKASDMAKDLIVPKSAVEGLGTAADNTAASTTGMSTAMGKVGTAALAASAGIASYSATMALLENASKSSANVQNLADDLDAFAAGSKPLNDALEEIGGNSDALVESFGKMDYTAGELARNTLSVGLFGDTPTEAREARDEIAKVDEALAQLAGENPERAREAFAALSSELRTAGYSQAEINATFDNYADALDTATQEANDNATASQGVADAQGAVITKLDESAQKWRDQTAAIKGTNDETERSIDIALGRLNASTGYGNAVAGVADAKVRLDEARASGDPAAIAEAERNLTDAISRQATAAVDLYEAQAEVNGTTVDGSAKTAILRQEMDKARESTGYWNDDLQVTRDQLTFIGQDHKAKVEVDVSDAKRDMQEVIDMMRIINNGGRPLPGMPGNSTPPTRDPDAGPRGPRRSNVRAASTGSTSGPFGAAGGVSINVANMNVGGIRGVADLQAHLTAADRRNGRRIGWGGYAA